MIDSKGEAGMGQGGSEMCVATGSRKLTVISEAGHRDEKLI